MAAAKPLTAFEFLSDPGKHPPQPVCVLYGDEPYLKRLAIMEIRQAVLGEDAADAELSLSMLDGDETQLRDVLDELSTIALFPTRTISFRRTAPTWKIMSPSRGKPACCCWT